MKKLLVVTLVLGLASAASAGDLDAVMAGNENELAALPIGGTSTIMLGNSVDGPYSVWIELVDPSIANYDGDPVLTAAGDPAPGDSAVNFYEGYDGWYEIVIASFNFEAPVVAGDHVEINIIGVSEGTTMLNLYASDGATPIGDGIPITVPEPVTIALLGLGGLFLRRRR